MLFAALAIGNCAGRDAGRESELENGMFAWIPCPPGRALSTVEGVIWSAGRSWGRAWAAAGSSTTARGSVRRPGGELRPPRRKACGQPGRASAAGLDEEDRSVTGKEETK